MPSSVYSERTVPAALRRARWHLMSAGALPPDLIPAELQRSWLRSWDAGLQPCGRTPGAPHASGAQLARALEQQRELVAYARPVMEFLLEQTRETDSMVVLAGTDGMLLHASGDPQFMGRAERVALRPGATWSEQYRGTNAIGTALTDDRALVVHAQEHFLERNGFLTCAAAPIHAADGRLLGVLDVSGDHRGYHRHTLALVRSAVRMIEHRLFDTRHDPRHWSGLRLRLHAQPEGLGTVTEGLLAVREDGLLVGASVTALQLLGLQWSDLGAVRIEQVLVESMHQLLEWCQRSPAVARLVHTVAGHTLWVKTETGRVLQGSFSNSQVHKDTAVVPEDALARIDTGDATLRSAIARARKVVDKPIPLLLQGESGVGKEVFARALHQSGPRQHKPFVAVNCAALPESLIEAELFGYQSGAFTGARREGAPGRVREADGGTLFLDEIGDMPFDLQTRLLRVLSDGQFYRVGGHQPLKSNVRVIAATHQNLEERVRLGGFREDLFHRLNVIRLRLPALRERREDIPTLARFFLQKSAKDLGVEAKRISEPALARLAGFDFPGNVRQLENICHWLTVMAPAQVIETKDLPPELLDGAVGGGHDQVPAAGSGLVSAAPLASAPSAVADWASTSAPHGVPASLPEAPRALGEGLPVPSPAMGGFGEVITAAPPVAATSGAGGWLLDLQREARERLNAGQTDVWDALTRQFEAQLIHTALELTRGRRIEAAQKLGIGRNTITRKIQELGIDD